MSEVDRYTERAYWLAWQMNRRRGRTAYDMAVRLMMQGIPERVALRVAEDVAERRSRRVVDSRDDLFFFGLFIVCIGTLLLLSMLLLSNMNAIMAFPSIIGLGIIITGLGLVKGRKLRTSP